MAENRKGDYTNRASSRLTFITGGQVDAHPGRGPGVASCHQNNGTVKRQRHGVERPWGNTLCGRRKRRQKGASKPDRPDIEDGSSPAHHSAIQTQRKPRSFQFPAKVLGVGNQFGR